MLIEILEKDKTSAFIKKEDEIVLQQFFPTANFSIKREDLNRIGEFDTKLVTCEDMDLSLRALKLDLLMYRNSKNKMPHIYRRTYLGLLKQWFFYGLGHPESYLKNEKRKGIRVYINLKPYYK